MKATKLIACIFAAMFLAAFPAYAASAENGKKIFSTVCAACHGPEGKGVPGLGPALNNQSFLSARDDIYIKNIVTNGKPGTAMPAMSKAKGGTLSDSDIEDVVAFVRSWQTAGAPSTPAPTAAPAAPASGDEIFAKNCAVCHGEKGKGGPSAPALAGNKFVATSSDVEIKNTITEGRVQKGMPPFKSVLSSVQIDEVVKYIKSLKKEELGVHLTQWNIAILVFSVLFSVIGLVYVYKHT